MSRFFSTRYASLQPYVPGEQPQDRSYVKLNTNESPFPPSPLAQKMAAGETANLQLYSDPDCRKLIAAAAEQFGVPADRLLFSNGSDESLNFAFMAFCDATHPAYFADITYGFYPVFAEINHIPYREIPLTEDFRIRVEDYLGLDGTIFIANPNAPTGIALKRSEIEQIVRANPAHVVVVDEAYVDFGAESAVPLTEKYDNLLVVQTFSKSRSLAGARLGFCIGCPELIRDLNTIRFSTNPYNINRMTMAAGIGALKDQAYADANAETIQKNRAYTAEKLKDLGFVMTDSATNFLFITSPAIGGQELYEKLKERGVLIRHFSRERIRDYNRVTIGTKEQMDIFLTETAAILKENKA